MSGSHMNHVTSLMWLMLATMALFTCGARRGAALSLPRSRAASRWAWRPRSVRSTPSPSRCRPASGSCCARCSARRAGASSSWRVPAWRCRWRCSAPSTGPPPARHFASATPSCGAARTTSAFTPRPWGDLHTPARGLELLNLYFLRLQGYLFETPFPGTPSRHRVAGPGQGARSRRPVLPRHRRAPLPALRRVLARWLLPRPALPVRAGAGAGALVGARA